MAPFGIAWWTFGEWIFAVFDYFLLFSKPNFKRNKVLNARAASYLSGNKFLKVHSAIAVLLLSKHNRFGSLSDAFPYQF